MPISSARPSEAADPEVAETTAAIGRLTAHLDAVTGVGSILIDGDPVVCFFDPRGEVPPDVTPGHCRNLTEKEWTDFVTTMERSDDR